MRSGACTALDLPGFAEARTDLTEADLTESDEAAVGAGAAIATDGAIKATTASAEMIFFIKNSMVEEKS